MDRTPLLTHLVGVVYLARLRRLALAGALLGTLTLASSMLARRSPGPAAMRAVPVGHEPIALALDDRTGHLFVANYRDATLSVLDARSGAILNTVALGQHPFAIAVDEDAGRVFTLNAASVATALVAPLPGPVTSDSGSVSVLDARSGTLLHTVTPGALPGALTVDEHGGHIFVLNSGDDTVSMLDARSGIVRRTVALDGVPQAVAVDAALGRLFVGTNGARGHLVVLDSRTGQSLRTITLGLSVGAVLAVPCAHRVVVAGDGLLRLLDARSGALLRTVRAAVVPLLAAPGSTRVLVAGAAGLRLLDAHTGRWSGPWVLTGWDLPPLWSEDAVSNPVSGQLVVAVQPAGATPGKLVVLDGRSGRVMRQIPAGRDVGALALDARTHRAAVLSPDAAVTRSAGPLAAVLAWSRSWLPWVPLPRVPVVGMGGSVRLIALS